MHFDGVVHLGDLINFVILVAFVVRLEVRVSIMYRWFSKHVLNGKKGD